MSSDPDPRAHALSRIDGLEDELAALALQATRLQGEIAALRASVAAIPVAPAAAQPGPQPAGDDELAGARLVALDLVLGGVPRDEAVLRMAVEFPELDVAELVDEAAAAG